LRQILRREIYRAVLKNVALLKVVAIGNSEPRIGRNTCSYRSRDRTNRCRCLPEQIPQILEEISQSQMSSTSVGEPRPTYSRVTEIVPDGRSGSDPAKKSQSSISSGKQGGGTADHRGETKLGASIKVSGLLSDSSTTEGLGGRRYLIYTTKNGMQICAGYWIAAVA